MQRCPGIVDLLDLQDIASFLRPVGSKRPQGAERLNVHPNTISKIRRDITFKAGEDNKTAHLRLSFCSFNAIIAQ